MVESMRHSSKNRKSLLLGRWMGGVGPIEEVEQKACVFVFVLYLHILF